jgi:hypothetical protein
MHERREFSQEENTVAQYKLQGSRNRFPVHVSRDSSEPSQLPKAYVRAARQRKTVVQKHSTLYSASATLGKPQQWLLLPTVGGQCMCPWCLLLLVPDVLPSCAAVGCSMMQLGDAWRSNLLTFSRCTTASDARCPTWRWPLPCSCRFGCGSTVPSTIQDVAPTFWAQAAGLCPQPNYYPCHGRGAARVRGSYHVCVTIASHRNPRSSNFGIRVSTDWEVTMHACVHTLPCPRAQQAAVLLQRSMPWSLSSQSWPS